MPKELNTSKLESNGIIQATTYLRGSFYKSEKYDQICENCNGRRNHYHVYITKNETYIRICFFCQDKIKMVS